MQVHILNFLNLLNKIILFSPVARMIYMYFYSTSSINLVLDIYSFDIVYLCILLYYFLSYSHAGMIVIDNKGNVAGGTSTNGLNHKIPGFVFLFILVNSLWISWLSILCKKKHLLYKVYKAITDKFSEKKI